VAGIIGITKGKNIRPGYIDCESRFKVINKEKDGAGYN